MIALPLRTFERLNQPHRAGANVWKECHVIAGCRTLELVVQTPGGKTMMYACHR